MGLARVVRRLELLLTTSELVFLAHGVDDSLASHAV